MRRDGDALGALAIVCIDNPMCPGTGHRICNDCMKACVFQKQEPVNIPQIETRVLTEVLSLPVGPRDLRPPHALEPARRPRARTRCRTTARTCSSSASGPRATRSRTTSRARASASSAIDGLKIEPLPVELDRRRDARRPRRSRTSARSTRSSTSASLLGFGGVSEYGITVRWDKNFLTLLYITLARKRAAPHLRRRPLRRHAHARRRVGARLRPRRARGGRGPADDHRHQEQPRRAASARRATS